MQAFRRRKTVLCWVTVILLAGMAPGCKQPEAPYYYGFQNLQVTQAPGTGTTLSTIVKLYNPNPYSLQLRRAEVDVAINGRHAGHSLLDSTIIIPRRDTFYVPIALQVDMKSIMSNILQSFLSKQAMISLDGRVRIKHGMLTFNRSFHYEGKQDIQSLLQNGVNF
jgi:LEA14-like dessication related protein